MQTDKTVIKTTTLIYPQIYAYILPDEERKRGWVKIGYTQRKNVDERIKEQTDGEINQYDYVKLWSDSAKFADSDQWFKDKALHVYLRNHKHIQQERDKKNKLREWFYYNGHPQQSKVDFDEFCHYQFDQSLEHEDYTLRNEQAEAVAKACEFFKNNPNGEFLWNAKPRFGKTLATYDLMLKMQANSVLVVTNRPAIANSWFDDFEKFIAWQTDFAFVSTSEALKNRPVITYQQYLEQYKNPDGKKRMIAFISLQDLKGAIEFGGEYDKLTWVAELKWDLLVIDESHEGVETKKTEDAFKKIERNSTLYLSGTPFKALASGQFHEEQIYNWTYADEQSAKVDWDVHQEEENPYEGLPCLNLFSYQMSQMITEQVNQGADIQGENIDYAFDLNEFFLTNESGKFIYEQEVKKWLDTLSHNQKYPFSTPELRQELKHTFWLLYRKSSARALEKLLREHEVFKDYYVVLAIGKGQNDNEENITPESNQKSYDLVKQAVAKHDKTITLSVGQLTTGITIPEWSAVMMLSNLESASKYIQAAFRAQNPWTYTDSQGQVYKKENAYVFDFSPERTLEVYDQFANNNLLGKNTDVTAEEREKNIRLLLNFFPVIAEDDQGKMVELNVNQVLTIPKAIKAQEVVRRGFMSNLLFQNVTGIFASPEVQEILEQLNPVDQGKTMPRSTNAPIDTKNVKVDEEGHVLVNPTIVVAQTDARFGEKVYGQVRNGIDQALNHTLETSKPEQVAKDICKTVENVLLPKAKEMAHDQGLTEKTAKKIVSYVLEPASREIEKIRKQADSDIEKVEKVYQKEMSQAYNNPELMKEIENYRKEEIEKVQEQCQQSIRQAIDPASLSQDISHHMSVQGEEKNKATVEDDVRARLRGFARTIPSFLMAYGEEGTTLANFDTTLEDHVFEEVTGITLEQFRKLRDEYKFFDPIVFDESVQTFLTKRTQLANYFDENKVEDIFDYIPPQQTNQIFTPKKVVKLMIDKLQEEDPTCFSDPNKTFADLYMKSGLYIAEIVKRLYVGLKEQIPDPQERLKHILEKQVYGFAPSEIIYRIARNFVFGFNEQAKTISDAHIVYLDTTPYAKGETDISLAEKCDELFGEKA